MLCCDAALHSRCNKMSLTMEYSRSMSTSCCTFPALLQQQDTAQSGMTPVLSSYAFRSGFAQFRPCSAYIGSRCNTSRVSSTTSACARKICSFCASAYAGTLCKRFSGPARRAASNTASVTRIGLTCHHGQAKVPMRCSGSFHRHMHCLCGASLASRAAAYSLVLLRCKSAGRRRCRRSSAGAVWERPVAATRGRTLRRAG